MGNLVQAELRKTTTVALWWALLIPTAVLALLGGLLAGLIGGWFVDLFSNNELDRAADAIGATPEQWKTSLFGIARSINFATIFPLVFGAMAISGEVGRRTITTTFLTATTRMHSMLAKLLVYVLWGAVYGLVTMLFLAIGVVITSDAGQLPDAGGWVMLTLVCVVSSILMTMFGIGLGALIPNSAGVTVLALMYFLVIENVVQIMLRITGASETVFGFLPNGSVNGITGAVAIDLFLSTAGVVPDEAVDGLRIVAGAGGAQSWWVSGLIFLAWTGVAFAGGWALTAKKDIT